MATLKQGGVATPQTLIRNPNVVSVFLKNADKFAIRVHNQLRAPGTEAQPV